MRTLADLKPGTSAEIVDLHGDDLAVQRIMEMGLTEGERVSVLRYAPTGDPIELRVRGYNLSIRRADASNIEISKD